MTERKKRKPIKRRPSKNEFDEIIEKKLNKEPVISHEDISDFKIDFGLYNKNVEKFLEQEKKNSPKKEQGKKKWLKRKLTVKKRRATKEKKFSSISRSINKNSELQTINTR